MKIGIITFNSAHNYGAVLQAWALQEYLSGQGHQVEIINFRVNAVDRLYVLYKPKNPFKNATLNKMNHYKQYLKVKKEKPAKVAKYKKFEEFIAKDLHTTMPYKNIQELRRENFDYDVMIAGSDQIWNGTLAGGINPAYFMDFGPEEAKRITYAASIGKDVIQDVEKFMFHRYLQNVDYISVREENAKGQIEPLIDKPVSVVLDPTLLLPKEKYDNLKKDPKLEQDYIYVHNVHLNRVDIRLNMMVEEMSNRLHLPVIQNHDDYDYSNELQKFNAGSPQEFIGMIANAKYVITNSFHATVFSIIYHRDFITIPHFQNPDRMKFLLNSLGIGNHLMDDIKQLPENLKELSIDYDKVEELRIQMRQGSVDFLAQALEGEKTTARKREEDNLYFDDQDVLKCYGCTACRDACPSSAITMQEDSDGFAYPVIDPEKCTHCDTCRKVCIYHKSSPDETTDETLPRVFAAVHLEEAVRKKAGSGGAFAAMYQKILEEGGKVVGVRLNEQFDAVYDIASSIKECEAFHTVKFVEADCGEVKIKVKELLESKTSVLFSGTPCQIAGLKSFLGQEYDNLTTIETACRGAASPKIFRLYKEYLSNAYDSAITDYQFQNKFRGFNKRYTTVEFESGETFLEGLRKNDYNRAYFYGQLQRPTCYTCEYGGRKIGIGDITLGDYTGVELQFPELAAEDGASFVKINSQKGLCLWEAVKDKLESRESNYENAVEGMVKPPLKLTMSRCQLFSRVGEEEIGPLLASFNPAKKKKKR